MRRRHAVLLAALSTVAAIAACTLNPQPLPPADFANAATDSDASPRSDSGSFGTGPESPGTTDAAAGTPSADADGAVDDGGDGGLGDGGDAGDAADADGG
ncbi:MAG: hypothetical protein QOI41_5035 [Myxococcales bacterium]|nr:hypothetical protein [Myxococcales bacterium]